VSSPSERNYAPHQWNATIGSSDSDIIRSNSGESLMGNLLCDVMLNHTQADFAFITHGEIYSDLYQGDITHLDMFRLLPFNRTLVVLEISGDTLKQIVEKSLGGIHAGMSISGGKVEYEPNRPAHNRLTFFEVGSFPLYPQKEYRVVTIDYLAYGNAGFDLLREVDRTRVFRTGTLLRDVLTEYIKQNSPLDNTKVKLDSRWKRK
jgi:2',3'-cyclic-nucleotide 2'-phosphodiesterase (5'-nucleotidase family)